MDLGDWLRGLGLERYEAAFRENEMNEKVLPSLTAEDLKDLGVVIVGQRRMLLDAIETLRAETSAKAPPPAAACQRCRALNLRNFRRRKVLPPPMVVSVVTSLREGRGPRLAPGALSLLMAVWPPELN
jgi:hypothetical protein